MMIRNLSRNFESISNHINSLLTTILLHRYYIKSGIPVEQVMGQLSSMLRRGTVQGIKHEDRNYYAAMARGQRGKG